MNEKRAEKKGKREKNARGIEKKGKRGGWLIRFNEARRREDTHSIFWAVT